MSRLRPLQWLVLILSIAAIVWALWRLEGARAGLEITPVATAEAPATLYRAQGDAPRRLVVLAHGFAGSRQLMEAYALTLARSGHAVLAFDFAGHGRNPVPMTGDVDSIEGTTRQLIGQTRGVIDAGLAIPGVRGPVALVGHSMATDVIVRAALEDARVGDVVAISMFSAAITATRPARLLAINGAWEPGLRAASLEALRLVDPAAEEGMTVEAGGVTRRVVAAPGVEHVGVLYSPVALTEARDWLGGAPVPVARLGLPIVALMAGLVALFWPLSRLVAAPADAAPPAPRLAAGRFAVALVLPALAAPVIATALDPDLLPVLIADYLMVHFALMGLGQLALAIALGGRVGVPRAAALALFLFWALCLFGLALDRYVASFWPVGPRWTIVAALALGTVPAMLAEAMLNEGGAAPLWRRAATKAALFASLGLAVALDFEGLLFLLFIVPVIVLFFVVFGTAGRWIAARGGAATAGLGLGLVLAWSLGVTFPLFAP